MSIKCLKKHDFPMTHLCPYAWKGTDCSLWMNMDKMCVSQILSYDNRHYYYGILLFWSNICIVNDFMVLYSWSQFFCYMHSLLLRWNAHCTRVFFCLCIIRNICARTQAMVLCKVHVGRLDQKWANYIVANWPFLKTLPTGTPAKLSLMQTKKTKVVIPALSLRQCILA